ncbi:MAG: hypothetical protein KUG73_01420, partial [Pseudomonadales bacterium]|nr:hypothetical protein [Pseudomonadales bacterium]
QSSAKGSVSLDKNLQPVFSIKTKTTGLYQVADLAEKHGYYTSLVRAKAHNVLDALSLKGSEQTGPVFKLEISLHDQHLLAKEMWLTTIDKIEW